jgi:hypothetical protein
MTLEAKLYSQASAYAPLQALLGTTPFAWCDTRTIQGFPKPSVTVLLVSGPRLYSNDGANALRRERVQFTIRDTDPQRARTVEAALETFLSQQFSANGGGHPNQIVNHRQSDDPQTEPLEYLLLVDAMIWNNTNL